MSGPSKYQVKLARKFGKRYGIKPSDLLDVIEHESSFNPGAVSSAGAFGLSQFIPSTAASYGVKRGTSKKAQKSQVKGEAKYLHELGWGSGSPAEIQKALAGYYGAASPYASQVISSSKYEKYDKHLKGALASKVKGGKALDTSGLSKKKERVQTQAPQSFAGDRAAAALAFIQDPNKDFTDYLNFESQMQSLQDIPGKSKQVVTGVKGNVKGGGKSEQAPQVKGAKGKGPTLKGGSKHQVVQIGKLAESMGLNVGENPHFGGVAPVHVTGSYHYSGRAIDVSGDPKLMRKFAHRVAKLYGPHLAELFWQGAGGINMDNGKRVAQGFVDDHTDHVHVAI